MMQQTQGMCKDCRGRGEIVDPEYACKECNSKKVVGEKKVLEVHIDKGMFRCSRK